ncbi:MAG: carboxylesterase family protein, partial [Oscillospiraceae bacterium]|nr:carboxylesterase family protein [Oscillospiraceae bacterium]
VAEVEYNYVKDYPYLIPTAPVVDGNLIPELPYDAVMHGAADGIETLIGTTKDEATLFARNSDQDIFPATRENMDKFFADHPQLDRKRIIALYSGKKELKIWQEIGKEVFFHLPSIELADHLAKHSTVYVHHFDYVYPMLKLLGLGAVHCTNSTLTSGGEPEGLIKFLGLFSGEKGAKMQEYIHGYWCNFISSGDPNGDGMPEWPEYGESKNTLFLDIPCHVEQDPFGFIRDAYGEVRIYSN